MTTLRQPTNNSTPCQVLRIDTRAGITRLALAQDTVTHAVRWFTTAELATVNTRADVEECVRAHERNQSIHEMANRISLERFESYMERIGTLHQQIRAALEDNTPSPPPVMVVELTPELAANVNHAIGCVVKVVTPVSLWHEAMVA